VPRPGNLTLTLTPVTDKALISGVVVQPLESATPPAPAKSGR
jgi:hypothetical protein